jgi:GTPase
VREQFLDADIGVTDVLEVSAVTGHGLDALRYRLGALVAEERARVGTTRVEAPVDEEVVIRLTAPGPDFEVRRDPDGTFLVVGRRMERWVQMLPLEDGGAVRYLQGRLRRAGVERALVAAGAREGDDVAIGDAVFEFAPDLDDLPPEERAEVLAAEAEELGELDDGLGP